MWGRFYWGTKGGEVGIVVVFAWLSSEERHLKPYLDLYYSLGWSSLVCHADFLTLFFPEKATSLADSILKELVKEIKTRTLPIVFAAFSGGPKGCMYKVIQLIEGKCAGQLSKDEYRSVGDCLCGQIYDSTPVDFTSDLGTRFVLHPSVLKMSSPPRVVSWMAKAFASGLDALFINRFEAQRADYWQTLYSSANFGPITIFCSEDDKLAPYSVVSNFAQRLQEQGADVNLVKWNSSPHVGHYKYHPDEYEAAVTQLLRKAAVVFANRRQHNGVSDMNNTSNPTPESVYDHNRTAESSNASLRRLAIDSTPTTDPGNNYSLPSSMEYHENQVIEKAELFHTNNAPSIGARGVLGQILYDVCVAENIEGWDLNPVAPFNGQHVLRNKHGAFNPVKCILRSRL
ncbi:hypothetical protein ACMD2_09873 [Ananas comosus]|uniref:Transmembrane protein 53 n=1 Tax=Ananas comosus TaxID=4615 RepID=A0A199UMS3_ANACO|nr:hypothetical protein ACMD2_09873 [Ananas comosus]